MIWLYFVVVECSIVMFKTVKMPKLYFGNSFDDESESV